MKVALVIFLVSAAVVACVIAGAIAFDAPNPPPPLASISNPFEKVDFGGLPEVEKIPARRGVPIAFRQWKATATSEPETVVIAIHGSSASSHSLHPLAMALSRQGITVYAPDIRGHGATGVRGDIDNTSQLDSDLEDFTAAVQARHPGLRPVLIGFSSGGGFALHAAASPVGSAFRSVVLLSPMLGPRATTVKVVGDAWAKPAIPRILGLLLLNRLGIHAFDHLATLAFAIQPARADILTGAYSFRLMRAFATQDYAADLKNAATPIKVLVGEKDELFDANLFAPTLHAIREDVPVTIVPGLNHIAMITDPQAVPMIAAAIRDKRG